MPHFLLEGFENQWRLVRETSRSQKFKVATPDAYEFAIDVHYTIEKVLTANIVFKGSESQLTKGVLAPVLDELARIALKHGDYAVIDYTLAHSEKIFEGNFGIDENDRKHRML